MVNDKRQVLTVQERFTVGPKRHWKLPGGHVEMGRGLTGGHVHCDMGGCLTQHYLCKTCASPPTVTAPGTS